MIDIIDKELNDKGDTLMNINPIQVLNEKIIKSNILYEQLGNVGIYLSIKNINMLSQRGSKLSRNGMVLTSSGQAYELILEEIEMPMNKYGYIIGNQFFNDHGILINSSIIEPGYTGNLRVTAYCFTDDIKLENGMAIGQLIVLNANTPSRCHDFLFNFNKK